MSTLRPDAFATPYRDPVFDGATDPVVIADPVRGGWLLFYTQRRATLDLNGVEWIHGTRVGVSRSLDAGVTWMYEGTVAGLENNSRAGREQTHWAPDVIRIEDRWLMLLTVVDGIHSDWSGEASIEQFESMDLRSWTWSGRVPLASPRVIDAAIARGDDGRYRLWFKDETRGSTTYVAVTSTPSDASSWREDGEVISGRPHEGPKAFRLGSWWWLIVDEWRGLAVHRSRDGIQNWTRQVANGGLLLEAAEDWEGRSLKAHHADVVALERDSAGRDRALIVYFTHPGERRSHIRSAVLVENHGTLSVLE
ncbi:MAG: glycoside hydrolase, family 43 [Frondihabitans sp.]|nr:glycoside hydrolase, family 43 [Frondihabitans sp.]